MAIEIYPWKMEILEIPIRNWNKGEVQVIKQGQLDIRNTYKELKLLNFHFHQKDFQIY